MRQVVIDAMAMVGTHRRDVYAFDAHPELEDHFQVGRLRDGCPVELGHQRHRDMCVSHLPVYIFRLAADHSKVL